MSTCYASEDPTFQPAMRIISAITQTHPVVVTTTFDHDYESGTIVRLRIPVDVGMQQIDKFVGEITVTGTDTFTLPVDASAFDAFSIPVSPAYYQNTCAQVVPVGEANDMLSAATHNAN